MKATKANHTTKANHAAKASRAVMRTPVAKPRGRDLDPVRLVHELEVHQAELETQNEELRTVRRELETALARYTEMFDFAPLGYVTLDRANTIQHVNHVGARLLGKPSSKLVGVDFAALAVGTSAQPFDAVLEQVRGTEEPAAGEVCLRRNGGLVVLRVTATIQPGGLGHLLLAFEDITRRKAEQKQLAETERFLREVNDRKDEFLAMLSHELRNPLAAIRTSMFVLANSSSGSGTSAEARGIVERQVTHLTRLVDDLLDVTRISRGKIHLQTERIDLVELVQRAVEDQRPGFDACAIALSVTSVRGPLWVDVDSARIVQTVSNLLDNARKFTPASGRVDVMLDRRDGHAELRVVDTGVGIPTELLPHVFEPFTQGPQSLDRRRGGLGLGLAMVKGFVELHGGRVSIASGGGTRGTRIAVTLPLSPAGAVVQTQPAPRVQARRVLVIEDQPDSAHALETALTLLGLEVRIATNGPSGVELARTFQPEVVLCDIGLPGMDGLEVARAFRSDRDLCDMYLIALSGYAQPEDVDRATRAGFSRHLAKPASIDTVVRIIAEAP